MRLARILSIAACVASLCLVAQEVALRRTNGDLRAVAPRLHFLAGKPLERMRNGASVTYDMQLIVLSENRQTVARRGFERFVISYDLWEEKFSATRSRGVRASVSHLSAEATEAWCLDHLSVPAVGLPVDRPVYVRLDVRAVEPKDRRLPDDEEGISLSRLIDIFSKAGNTASGNQWRAEAGPVLLQNLKP